MAIKIKKDKEKVQPVRGRKWGEHAEAFIEAFGTMKKGESFTVPADSMDEVYAIRQVLNRLKKTKIIQSYRTNYNIVDKKIRIWR
jgi:hypothetical protein